MVIETKLKAELLPQDLAYSAESGRIIEGYFDALGQHDNATAQHCKRVADMCWAVVRHDFSLPHELIYAGALLHDVGKTAIPEIYLRPEDNGHEFKSVHYEKIKSHAQLGYFMLKDTLPQVALVAGGHHFKNGNGYGVDPRADDEVVCALKYIELADYIDAMRTRADAHHMSRHRLQPLSVMGAVTSAFPDASSQIVKQLTNAAFKAQNSRVFV